MRASAAAAGLPTEEIDSTVALIQALIPLGPQAVGEALDAAVTAWAGLRYCRTGGRPGVVRWGQQPGSVYLADQKLPIPVPRVRDRVANREIPLATYERLQVPRAADAGLFRKVLVGLTCRQYAACAEAVPAAFGLSASSVSRRFIRVSARHLQTVCERRLDRDEFVALGLDGKTFAADTSVMALGITTTGRRRSSALCRRRRRMRESPAAFLQARADRGLRPEAGLLCVIDGAKGLRKAIQTVFGSRVVVQRCQWHKRQNVVRDLPKAQQATWRRRLQQAYERPTYTEASTALGLTPTGIAHPQPLSRPQLGRGPRRDVDAPSAERIPCTGISLKTTNCLESLNAQLGQLTDKVDHGARRINCPRVASALLAIEPRLRRIKGYRHLPQLQMALRTEIQRESVTETRIA